MAAFGVDDIGINVDAGADKDVVDILEEIHADVRVASEVVDLRLWSRSSVVAAKLDDVTDDSAEDTPVGVDVCLRDVNCLRMKERFETDQVES